MKRALPVLALLLSLFTVACSQKEPSGGERTAAPSAAPENAEPAPEEKPYVSGNAERGKELVKTYECNRCHEGTGLAAVPIELACFGCHVDIDAGKFKGPPDKMAKWKKHVQHVMDVPSLDAAGKRFQERWLAAFLQNPTDLRPHLAPSMPRMKMSDTDARDIAAYLARDAAPAPAVDLAKANAENGRKLLETKGCGTCHALSGAPALPMQPNAVGPRVQPAVALAPDLAHVRERIAAPELVRWLMNPKSVKPNTLMPSFDLTLAEAADIAAYLLTAKLTPEKRAVPARLPLLTRPVTFDEVNERVLSKTCRHCHGNPDIAGGDGGPGSTGGFGFPARHLDLSTYTGVASGWVGEDGERHSIFSNTKDGTPRLLAALYARQAEEAGVIDPDVRGMPLGMPALPSEDIQLLATWIAQGRHR
ncbi:MAG: c-type cytochrome [Myxococcales bacterium]|nr:c-type cytochrome [Myxococcales bacterium]